MSLLRLLAVIFAVLATMDHVTGLPQIKEATKNEIDNTIPQKIETVVSTSVTDPPKSSTDTSKSTTDTSKSITDASKSTTDTSKSTTDNSKSTVSTSKSTRDISKSETTTLNSEADSSKSEAVVSKPESVSTSTTSQPVTSPTTSRINKVHITRTPPTAATPGGFSKLINDVFQIPISVLKAVSGFLGNGFGLLQRKN